MKRILLPAFAAALLSSTAFAADLPARGPALAPAPVYAAPIFTWTGFYVGAQAGYAWGKDRSVELRTATGVPTGFAQGFSTDGFVGGLHAGYNHQMGQFVLGLEADVEYSGMKGGYRLVNTNGTDSKIGWQGSLRARAGFAVDRALIYATGGLALADIKHTYIYGVTPATESFSKTRAGWTAGAGVEYAFTQNVTGRVEYRYTDFGTTTNNSLVAFPGLSYRQNPTNHAVRVGLSYLFSTGGGAVVAKY